MSQSHEQKVDSDTKESYKSRMNPQRVRGTRDIYGDPARIFREIEQYFINLASIYNFHEIQTPLFEFTHVFQRTLGAESDIVNKEMYTFKDRNGDSLTLRPEGTASVVRAVISNDLLRSPPVKLFYSGPMFRYERPQKGRYRQFHQLGIELVGVDQPLADIEVISFAWDFLVACGLKQKVQLKLNSIGDESSRKEYKKALVSYFSKHKTHLSEDSVKRLSTNPLRILDSKDEGDKELIKKAPLFGDFINQASKDFFQQVTEGLENLKIPYQIHSRLVRGLDYYNHTVFEYTTDQLGAQDAVLSGGRYNGLVEQMGGSSTPGVGWAAGVDRLALLMKTPKKPQTSVAIITAHNQARTLVLKTLHQLRQNKIPSQPIYSGNISKQMKKAQKRSCSHVLFIGEEELQSGAFEYQKS